MASSQHSTQRKWKISYNGSLPALVSSTSSSSSSSRKLAAKAPVLAPALPTPPGLVTAQKLLTDTKVGEESSTLMTADAAIATKQRQVMGIATSPGRNLLTTAFMLWMSGSSIQIFSIMMTGMALVNPLKAIVETKKVFAQYESEEGVDLKVPKLIFVSLQLLSVALALYKCASMGLLPVTSADWTSLLPEKHIMDWAAMPVTN